MSKYYDDEEYYDDDDYYDDNYDDYGDDYDEYGGAAVVQKKQPAKNQNATNKNQTTNKNQNQTNSNSNAKTPNNTNKNNKNNKNNNNNKNNKTQDSNSNPTNSHTPLATSILTPQTSLTSQPSASSKSISSADLCPPSWIAEKNDSLSKLWDAQGRPTQLSTHMLMIGHVDSGKSSTLGRLLLTQNRVTSRTLELLQKEASSIGKGSFALAWISDEQATERSRGVTVDVASKWFQTQHRTVYVWDCPGHRDFVGNMLSAANHAKSAVLLVSARTGEFESGIGYQSAIQQKEGVQNQVGQTREHALLAFGSGVRNIIVAVNKMDEVNWDKERYLFICRETKKMLAAIGFNVSPGSSAVRYVPISATTGINVPSSNPNHRPKDALEKPQQLSDWYLGPSLIDLIDTLPSDNGSIGTEPEPFTPIPTTGPNPEPFSLAVHETFISPLFGLSVHGKVLTGSCALKEKIVMFPTGYVAKVKGIECRGEMVEGCFQGDVVTLQVQLENSKEDLNNTLSTTIVTDPYPPQFGRRIVAHIHSDMTMGAIPLIPGANLIIHSQHLHSLGTISKIIHSRSLAGGDDEDNNTTTVSIAHKFDEEDEAAGAEAEAEVKSPKSPKSPKPTKTPKTAQQIQDSELVAAALATKTVAKKRMITDNSVSVVEILLQIPLPFVHLNKWRQAVNNAQRAKEEYAATLEDKSLLSPSSPAPTPPLVLDKYTGPVDRICIRRGNETVATGVVFDVLEEERYDFVI